MPEIDPLAFQGLAGRIVLHLAPTTEADPVALLVTLLATAGAVIGDGPHVQVGADLHPARIWPLLIGRTSSGRKGTAQNVVSSFVDSFDPYFVQARMKSGLSSGEGLIRALSPPQDDDPEPHDPRLLVVETEFTRVLNATKRDGNTLSQILRTLWEQGDAHVLTRTDPLTVKGAHLVVVGHATPRELLLKMSDADIAGGFANRFMPVLVKRVRLIPDEVDTPDHRPLAEQFDRALRKAQGARRMRRTPEASMLWRAIYAALNEDERDGVLGEVLARGPATILRLSLLYALLDEAPDVDAEHLLAATALWKYVEDSAKRIYGDLSGNAAQDRLVAALKAAGPDGMLSQEIFDLFSGNKTATEIDALLTGLGSQVKTVTERTGRPGRPPKRTYWVDGPGGLARLLDGGTP